MTNEVKKVELTNGDGFPRRYTVASNVAITKGTILALTDARTAIAASATGQPIAGIAAMAKSATDNSTSISVWTDGVFEAIASSAVTAGAAVMSAGIGGTNYVIDAEATCVAASGAAIIGYALGTGSDEETINIRIRL